MDQKDQSGIGDLPAALARAMAVLEQALAEGRAELAARRAQHHAARSQLKSERERASDLAWELEDLEQHLRELQTHREGPTDLLLEREIASIASQRATVEELALSLMLQIDELASWCAEEEQRLIAYERDWGAHEALLVAERERIAALLQEQHPANEDRASD